MSESSALHRYLTDAGFHELVHMAYRVRDQRGGGLSEADLIEILNGLFPSGTRLLWDGEHLIGMEPGSRVGSVGMEEPFTRRNQPGSG